MDHRLKKAVQSINKLHPDASFCSITGDITHFGEIRAFNSFSSIMNSLSVPWFPIPGNHDARQAFFKTLKQVKTETPGFIQFSLRYGNDFFVFLDTLDEGKASGYLCKTRLNWLQKKLEIAEKSKLKTYIFMHHAPMNVGIQALDKIKLSNSSHLKKILMLFPKVRHLFLGHLHRPCHGSWSGIPFSSIQATAHQIALDFNTQSLKLADDETPAYAVVLISENNVIIHNHSYLSENNIATYNL